MGFFFPFFIKGAMIFLKLTNVIDNNGFWMF
jgi:hypothetical protein